MAVKADLKIILQANEVVVAESDDQQLWQKVLAAINSGSTNVGKPDAGSDFGSDTGDDIDSGEPIAKFAKQIGITVDEAIGSCDPSLEAPYIHLDKHHWESLKKNTPKRGPNAVSATALTMTLLVLWKEIAGLEGPTMKEAKDVRETIGADDKSPARSVKNCEWLQERNSRIRLNPSQTSKAIAVAKAYCQKTSISE